MELDIVQKLLANLRKAPNRKYSLTFIEKTKKHLAVLRETLVKNTTSKSETETFDKIVSTIDQFLKPRQGSESSGTEIEEENSYSNNMSAFNLETALKAIPIFNGQYKELEPFLKIIELLHRSYTADARISLIEFVTSIKLNAAVRTALGPDVTTLEELKKRLQERYKSNFTIAQVHTQLALTTQKNNTVINFKDKILNLVSELNRLQINELGNTATSDQKAVVGKMNEKYALTIFKNGLENRLKTTLFAAQPKDFNTAVDIAQEIERDTQNSSSHIFSYRVHHNRQQHRQFNNYNNRNNPQNINRYNNTTGNNTFRYNTYQRNNHTDYSNNRNVVHDNNNYNKRHSSYNNSNRRRYANNNNRNNNQRNSNQGSNRHYMRVISHQGNMDGPEEDFQAPPEGQQ